MDANGLPETRVSRRKPLFVLPETVALASIGCVDLISTIYLLATGQAHEANPLMAAVLFSAGPRGFVLAKALLLGGPLAVAEMARSRAEPFVRLALRACIVLYLGLYALGFVHFDLPRL